VTGAEYTQTPGTTEAETAGIPAVPRPRKKLVRRAARDRSQRLRLAVQIAFLALNVFIGAQFYLFVRYFETGGQTPQVPRPPGVEGWLPIAGMMNLRYFLSTWTLPSVHPAAMFLLVAFLSMSFLFRKAFCGWLCPVGTLSESLWKLGRRIIGTNLRLPRWVDTGLRSLKYLLLFFFVYAVVGMSAAGIEAFLQSPYGIVADVKMLNFFRFLGSTGAITLGALVVLSVLVKNFWCRYLCPYGALMGLAALFSPSRIRREPERCVDCAKCAKACPALLAVDRLVVVRSAECTACLECVAVCPADGALYMSLPQRRRLPAWALAAGVAVLFFGIVLAAKLAGSWHTVLPGGIYRELILRSGEFDHPR
jgi:polyferredoxin